MTRKSTAAIRPLCALLLASVALGGCATMDRGRDKLAAYGDNVPALDSRKVDAFVTGQNEVYDRLVMLAPVDAGDYRPIVDGGMMYVDLRCARYMDALFWFNRAREGTNRQLGYLGSASAAILEIVGASRELMSLTPLGIKFASETVDNVGKGLLYDLSPAAIRSIVDEQQIAFKKAIEGNRYRSKTAALQVIQAYVMLCLPASIEGQVEKAVTEAKFQEKQEPAPKPTPTPTPTAGERSTTGGDAKSAKADAPTTSSHLVSGAGGTVTATSTPPAPRDPRVDTVPILEMRVGD